MSSTTIRRRAIRPSFGAPFAAVFLALTLSLSAAPSQPPVSLAGKTIVVDPGHGTINYEAQIINSGKETDAGVREYRLNFEIAQRLGKALRERGARVVFTRTPFDYWRQSYSAAEDNKMRAFFANELKADAFIAIHCDWDPRSKIHGVTTLYEKPDSERLGESIHRKLVKKLGATDRHLIQSSYTVLDHAEVPAIIVETGFLSNRAESRKLRTKDYQEKIARAIADGFGVYFGT